MHLAFLILNGLCLKNVNYWTRIQSFNNVFYCYYIRYCYVYWCFLHNAIELIFDLCTRQILVFEKKCYYLRKRYSTFCISCTYGLDLLRFDLWIQYIWGCFDCQGVELDITVTWEIIINSFLEIVNFLHFNSKVYRFSGLQFETWNSKLHARKQSWVIVGSVGFW